jgi:hypothetical protein
MLAIAVWAAVKNALSYAGREAAAKLRLPATGEEILRCLTEAANSRRPSAVGEFLETKN